MAGSLGYHQGEDLHTYLNTESFPDPLTDTHKKGQQRNPHSLISPLHPSPKPMFARTPSPPKRIGKFQRLYIEMRKNNNK